MTTACQRSGCPGTVDESGFCDTCGHEQAVVPPQALAPSQERSPVSGWGGRSTAAPVSGGVTGGGSLTGSGPTGTGGRSSTGSRISGPTVSSPTGARTGSGRTGRRGIGGGQVEMPPIPAGDPADAVMKDPEIPEHERFCPNPDCAKPVGRSRDGKPGRIRGFCPYCGTPFFFGPRLEPNALVGRRYRIVGSLARGGLGWIYLARDEELDGNWVVLKGLIDANDADARAAVEAERQFLTRVDHPNVVRIYGFTEHPDPLTGTPVGYLAMEYVGGRSLQQLIRERHADQPGASRLKLEHVLAYGIDILGALGHLHDLGAAYCDLKPDNVLVTADRLKLIDLGAVYRFRDDERVGPHKATPAGSEGQAIFGTVGFQTWVEELQSRGPGVASDIFTVGRTLATLAFRIPEMTGAHRYTLPPRESVPVLAENESFDRLLRRATRQDPDARFTSAEEMAEQLTGVLRQVLAVRDNQPQEAPSSLFAPETGVVGAAMGDVPPLVHGADAWDERTAAVGRAAALPLEPPPSFEAATRLPVPQVDPLDPAAGLLATVGSTDPAELLRQLEAFPVTSVEVLLRRSRAHIEVGARAAARLAGRQGAAEALRHEVGAALAAAGSLLDQAEREAPGDWRIRWYRGLVALADGVRVDEAAAIFDGLYDDFPGELAPQLALGVVAERAGRTAEALGRYEAVWRTSHLLVGAAFGVARTRLRGGDRRGAVAALDQVPASSPHRTAAAVAAVRACVAPLPSGLPGAPGGVPGQLMPVEVDLWEAARRLTEIPLVGEPRERLVAVVQEAALRWAEDGGRASGAGGAAPRSARLLGGLVEPQLRVALETSYREIAQKSDDHDRVWLVDRANYIRPRSLV